jgi:hypothetical protein
MASEREVPRQEGLAKFSVAIEVLLVRWPTHRTPHFPQFSVVSLSFVRLYPGLLMGVDLVVRDLVRLS